MHSNQFIQYGDIVLITSHEGKQKFHLRGRSLMEEGLYFSKNKELSLDLQTGMHEVDLNDSSMTPQCLFQIHPKFNYDAYLELSKLEVSDSRYESFLRRWNHEQEVNKHLQETMTSQVVQFGKEVQLYHLASKSFVSITRERNKGHSLYLLKLTNEGSKSLHFKIRPFYTFRKDGDRVSFDDVLIFENIRSNAYIVYNSLANPNEDAVEPTNHSEASYKSDEINYRDLHILPTMENSFAQLSVLAGCKDTDQYNSTETEMQANQKEKELVLAASSHCNTFQVVFVCKEPPYSKKSELFFGQMVRVKGMNINQQVGYLVSETNFSGFAPEVYFRVVTSKDRQFRENIVANVFEISATPGAAEPFGEPLVINSRNTSRFALKHFLSGFYLGAKRHQPGNMLSWFLVKGKTDFFETYKELEEKVAKASKKPEKTKKQLSQAGNNPLKVLELLNWEFEWFSLYFTLTEEQLAFSEVVKWLTSPPYLSLAELEGLFSSLISLEAVLTTSDDRKKINSSMCFAIYHPQCETFLSINYEEELSFIQNQIVETNPLHEFFQNRFTNIVSGMKQDYGLSGTSKMTDFFYVQPCDENDYYEQVNMISCVSGLSSILIGQSISEVGLFKAKELMLELTAWCSDKQDSQQEESGPSRYSLQEKQSIIQEIGIIDLLLSLLMKFKKNIRILAEEESFVSFIVSCVDLLLKSITKNYSNAVYVFQFDSLFSSMIFSSEIVLPEKIKLDLLLSNLFVETNFHSSYAEIYLKTIIPHAKFDAFDFRALNIIYSLCQKDSSKSAFDEDNSVLFQYLIDNETARNSLFKPIEMDAQNPGKTKLIIERGKTEYTIDSAFDADKKTMMYTIRTIELASLIAKMGLHSKISCFKQIFPLSCCMNIIMNASIHPFFRSCVLDFVHNYYFTWKTRYKQAESEENQNYQLESGLEESMDLLKKLKLYHQKSINTFFNEEINYERTGDNAKTRYNMKKVVLDYLWHSQQANSNSESKWAKSLFSFCKSSVQKGFYSKLDMADLRTAIYHYLKFLVCVISSNSDIHIARRNRNVVMRRNLLEKRNGVGMKMSPELRLDADFLSTLSSSNPDLIESLIVLMETLQSIEKHMTNQMLSEFFGQESVFRFFDINKIISAIPPDYKNKRQFLNQFSREREDFLMSTATTRIPLPHPSFTFLLIEFLSLNNIQLVEKILQLLSMFYNRKKHFLDYVNNVQFIFKKDASEKLFKELQPTSEFLNRIALDLKQPGDSFSYFKWINEQLQRVSLSLYEEIPDQLAELATANGLKSKGVRHRQNKTRTRNVLINRISVDSPKKNTPLKDPQNIHEASHPNTKTPHPQALNTGQSPSKKLEDIAEELEEEGENFHNYARETQRKNREQEKAEEDELVVSEDEEGEQTRPFSIKKPEKSAKLNLFNEVLLNLEAVDLKQQTLRNLGYQNTLMAVLKRVMRPRNKRDSEFEETVIQNLKKAITRHVLLVCIYMCYDNKTNQKELHNTVWKELTAANIESILDDSELHYYLLKLVHEMYKNNYELINSFGKENEIPHLLIRSMWRRFSRVQHKKGFPTDLRVCSNIANVLSVFFKYFDINLQSLQVLYSYSIKTGMDFAKVDFSFYLVDKVVPFLENNPQSAFSSEMKHGVIPIRVPDEISFVISLLRVVRDLSETNKTTVLSQSKTYVSLSALELLFEKSSGWVLLKNALSRYFIKVYLSANKIEESEMDQLAVFIRKLVAGEHRQFSEYIGQLFVKKEEVKAVFQTNLQDIQGGYLFSSESPFYCSACTQSKFDEYMFYLEHGLCKILKRYNEKISLASPRDVEMEVLLLGIEKLKSILRTMEYAKGQFMMMKLMDLDLELLPSGKEIPISQPLDRAVTIETGKGGQRLFESLFRLDKNQRSSIKSQGNRLEAQKGTIGDIVTPKRTPIDEIIGRGRSSSGFKGAMDLRASEIQAFYEEKDGAHVSEPSKTEEDSLFLSLMDINNDTFLVKDDKKVESLKKELNELCTENEKIFKVFLQHDYQNDFRVVNIGQMNKDALVFYSYPEMGMTKKRVDEKFIKEQHQKEFDQLIRMLVLVRDQDENKFRFVLQQLMRILGSDFVTEDMKYFTLKMIRGIFNFASKPKSKNKEILEDLSSIGFINFTCQVIARNTKDKQITHQFVQGLIDFLSEPSLPTQQRIYAYIKAEENTNFFIHSILEYIWSSTMELRQHEQIRLDPFYVHVSTSQKIFQEKNDLMDILAQKKEEISDLLDFIHLACENHFAPIQNILRTQNLKLRNMLTLTNLVFSLASLFDKFWKLMTFENASIGIKFLEVFTELCQGPCAGNQQELAKTKLFQNLEDILIGMQMNRIMLPESQKSEFIRKTFILFASAAEGSKDEILFDKILLHLPVDFVYQRLQTILLNTKKEKEKYLENPKMRLKAGGLLSFHRERIKREMFKNFLKLAQIDNKIIKNSIIFVEEALQMGIALKFFKSKVPSFETRLMNYHNAQLTVGKEKLFLKTKQYLNQQISSVEIVNPSGELEIIHFPLVPLTRHLSEYSKEKFQENVNRDSANEKIFSLLRAIPELQEEMVYYEKLHNKKLYINVKQFALLRNVNLCLSLAINLYTIFTDISQDEGLSDLGKYSSPIFYLGIIQLFLSVLIFVIWVISKLYLEFRAVKRNYEKKIHAALSSKLAKEDVSNDSNKKEANNKNQLDSAIKAKRKRNILGRAYDALYYYYFITSEIAFKTYLVYLLIYVTFGTLAIFYSNVFYSFLMLDIIDRSAILKNVILSISMNYTQLVMTAILTLIIIFVFSAIGFFTSLRDTFLFINDGSSMCSSMTQCFLSMAGFGFRSGGGIGEVIEYPDFQDDLRDYLSRYFFDLIFFLIVIIIMLNIVFGIIIDTFAELRDKRSIKEYDRKQRCFICSIERSVFEKASLSFKKHVEKEHFIWNYVYFLVYLNTKEVLEFTGTDTYVKEKVDREDLSWVPINSAIVLKGEVGGKKHWSAQNLLMHLGEIERNVDQLYAISGMRKPNE